VRRIVGILILLATSGWAGDSPAEMLAAHNAVRARLKLPPLKWSERLAGVSQQWASTLVARGQFVHNPDSSYGENLFAVTGAAAAPAQVVKAWASEARNYDYRGNKCRAGQCGHYTQIVWRDTSEVGCGVARGGGREVWVCNYDPPGNWVGERPY
jgi:uncharacterized protein YkwD